MKNDLTEIMVDYAAQLGVDIGNKLYVRYTPDRANEIKKAVQQDKYVREVCAEVVKNLILTLRECTEKYIMEEIGPALLEQSNAKKGDNNDIHTADGPTDNSNISGPYTRYTLNDKGVQAGIIGVDLAPLPDSSGPDN